MTKHTKGPWTYRRANSGNNRFWIEGPQKSNAFLAECNTRPTENEANAQLIAAAPALLEACRALLLNAEIDALNESEEDNADLHSAIRLAEKAIQQATGEAL